MRLCAGGGGRKKLVEGRSLKTKSLREREKKTHAHGALKWFFFLCSKLRKWSPLWWVVWEGFFEERKMLARFGIAFQRKHCVPAIGASILGDDDESQIRNASWWGRLRSLFFTPVENPAGSSTQCSRGTRETRLGRMRVGTPGLRLRKISEKISARQGKECNVFAVRDDQECESAQWRGRTHAREQTTGGDRADYTSHLDVFVFVLPSEDFQTCKLGRAGRACGPDTSPVTQPINVLMLFCLLPQRGSEEPGWFLSHDPTHT